MFDVVSFSLNIDCFNYNEDEFTQGMIIITVKNKNWSSILVLIMSNCDVVTSH